MLNTQILIHRAQGDECIERLYLLLLIITPIQEFPCRAPLQKGCRKHHGHKGDPGVTPGTCRANGDKAQVIQVWVRAPVVGNVFHPQ